MRVKNYSEGHDKPGSFWWVQEPPTRLMFACPCGCGLISGVSVAVNLLDRNGKHPVWKWNGDLDKPSLTPSIQVLDGCKWHGFLTYGQFRNA